MILCEQNLADFGFEFSLTLAEQIAATLTNRDLELVLLDESAMKTLNFEQRGVNKATDVLSFPLTSVPSAENAPRGVNFGGENAQKLPLGSIVINKDAVFSEASRLKHSTEAEFTLLFLHALLHLLGFNHETDEGQMREKEAQIITQFKLPESLIIRNER